MKYKLLSFTEVLLQTRSAKNLYELFWGCSNQSRVIRITDSDKEKRGFAEQEIKVNMQESTFFWRMVENPSSELNEILTRQQVFKTLLADQMQLKQLIRDKNRFYDLRKAFKYLLDVDYEEYVVRRVDKEYQPRPRIRQLFEDYAVSLNWPEIEITFKGKNSFDDLDTVSGFMKELTVIPKMLNNLATALLLLPDNFLSGHGTVLTKALQSLDLHEALQKALNGNFTMFEAMNDLLHSIEGKIQALGAILRLAEIASDSGYALVTFDEDYAENYIGAWQFKKKYDSCSDGKCGSPKKRQVPNDSPKDKAITVLTGDIMSGKSFNSETDFQLRILAQSTGLVPANSANLHIYHILGLLGRGLTDAANNLSAYGSDVMNLRELLDKAAGCTGKALLITDEWGSTTAHTDQNWILQAFADYCRERAVKVRIATHNDLFVKANLENADVGIYHLQTRPLADGKVEFLYKLVPGISESHILEIAENMGFNERVLQIARDYLQGNLKPAEIKPLKVKQLHRYNDAERALMKQQAVGFMPFFPSLDELIPIEREIEIWEKETGRQKIKVTTLFKKHTEDIQESRDRLRNLYTPVPRPKYQRLFLKLSDDEDFKYGLRRLNVKAWDFLLQDFFYEAPILEPAALLERQRLFAELIANDRYSEFSTLFDKLWGQMRYFSHFTGIAGAFDRFNSFMLEKTYNQIMEGQDKDYYREEVSDTGMFMLAVKLNVDLLKLPAEKLDLENDFAKLTRILEIHKEQDRMERVHDYKDETDSKAYREQRSALYREVLKLAKLKSKPEKYTEVTKRAMGKIVSQLYKKLKPLVKPVNLYDLNTIELNELFAKYSPEFEKVYNSADSLFNKALVMFKFINLFLDGRDYSQELVSLMKSYDSVYLHQLANYFERCLKAFWGEFSNGLQILERLKEDKINYELTGNANMNFDQLEMEIKKLDTLFALAKFFKEEGFAEVEFNENGELNLTELWSLLSPKAEQVHNSFAYNTPDKSERVKILSGFNMSGKSMAEKSLVLGMLCAQVTGFAPARKATMPIMDGVAITTRVKARTDKNLSAGGTEITYRKKLYEFLQQRELAFVADDETFSTVPPKYQGALTYGFTTDIAERGHLLTIAHHHHEYVADFLSLNHKITGVYNFHTDLRNPGEVIFTHRVQEGHQLSHAIDVAESLGLQPEIIERAREIERGK
ncbi:MAG: hypothetical protein PHV30_10300 [Candidatus Margulisbacteria bacterium]|nr:hypothetical protein [Candidatus Margulisiibacteriota bacterium]